MSNVNVNGVMRKKKEVLTRSTRIQRTHLVNRICSDKTLLSLPPTSQQWNKLAKELNAMGPPKSANNWKQAWRDIKKKTEHVYNQPIDSTNREVVPANEYDQKILTLLAMTNPADLDDDNGEMEHDVYVRDDEAEDGDTSTSHNKDEYETEPEPIVYVATDGTPQEQDTFASENGSYMQENFIVKPTPTSKLRTNFFKSFPVPGDHLNAASAMRHSGSAESSIKNLEELASRQVDIFDRFLSFIERTEEKRLQLEERSLNMQNRLLDITQEMVKVIANK